MNKYIKGFNAPWLKVETPCSIRIININEIRDIDIDKIANRAWISYKDGHQIEIIIEVAYVIANFLMVSRPKQKFVDINLDTLDLAYENQTMNEWLDENGQK